MSDLVGRPDAYEAELRKLIDLTQRHIAALEAENKRLREAVIILLPSNLGPVPHHLDDGFVFPVDITAGEIRAARAALAEGGRECPPSPACTMCDGYGYKDHASFRMEPCDCKRGGLSDGRA